MVKEIGSEFWNVPTQEEKVKFFPQSTQWFLSGRSALKAIINELEGCKTVALPSWCCDSVIKPFCDAGFTVYFYSVWFDHKIHIDLRFDCDVLFVMDFFGYTTKPIDYGSYKGVVIRDITHSVFSLAYTDANYYFGSLRKWCGVWTGGYAYSKDGHKINSLRTDDGGYAQLRKQAMEMKESYLKDESVGKAYLQMFEVAENLLEQADVLPAHERDVQLANRIDVGFIIRQRRANAELLRNEFSQWLLFPQMQKADCPMFVPVLVPDGKRNVLRRYLCEHSIYCPVHWPISNYHQLTSQEQIIYDNELSLVCDQRYTVEDMDRIITVIRQFMEE